MAVIGEQSLATWNEHNDKITHSYKVKYVEKWDEVIKLFDGGGKPKDKKRRRPI